MQKRGDVDTLDRVYSRTSKNIRELISKAEEWIKEVHGHENDFIGAKPKYNSYLVKYSILPLVFHMINEVDLIHRGNKELLAWFDNMYPEINDDVKHKRDISKTDEDIIACAKKVDDICNWYSVMDEELGKEYTEYSTLQGVPEELKDLCRRMYGVQTHTDGFSRTPEDEKALISFAEIWTNRVHEYEKDFIGEEPNYDFYFVSFSMIPLVFTMANKNIIHEGNTTLLAWFDSICPEINDDIKNHRQISKTEEILIQWDKKVIDICRWYKNMDESLGQKYTGYLTIEVLPKVLKDICRNIYKVQMFKKRMDSDGPIETYKINGIIDALTENSIESINTSRSDHLMKNTVSIPESEINKLDEYRMIKKAVSILEYEINKLDEYRQHETQTSLTKKEAAKLRDMKKLQFLPGDDDTHKLSKRDKLRLEQSPEDKRRAVYPDRHPKHTARQFTHYAGDWDSDDPSEDFDDDDDQFDEEYPPIHDYHDRQRMERHNSLIDDRDSRGWYSQSFHGDRRDITSPTNRRFEGYDGWNDP
jgi:hypothetical protein